MRSHEADACGENGALAVALYGSSFKDKVVIIGTFATEHSLTVKRTVDEVVLVGCKLLAPAIKTKVEQAASCAFCIRRFGCGALVVSRDKGDEGMVACPSVVIVTLVYAHTVHLFFVKVVAEHLAHLFRILGGYHERLIMSYGLGQLKEGLGDVLQIRTPVCILVRPSELHTCLTMPFCRQYISFVV